MNANLKQNKQCDKNDSSADIQKGTILAILGNNIKSTSKVIEIVLIEQNEPEATMRIMINFIIDTTLGFPFVQQCRKNAMPQKSYSHRVRYNAPFIFF